MFTNKALVAFIIYLFVAYISPLVITDTYYVDVLTKATFYLCMAVSLSVLIGHLGMLSFAHPAFLGIGAYASALLSLKFGWPVLVCIIMGGLVAGLFALVVAFPLMKLNYHSFAIGTLAFLMIIKLTALNWVGLTRGPRCLYGLEQPLIKLGNISLDFSSDMLSYYLILIFATLTIVFCYSMVNSRFGRALNAIREDETLAKSAGANPYKYKIIAFTISAFFPGLAGAFFGHHLTVVCPRIIDFQTDIYLLIMVIVGGATSLSGVIFGSYLFTFLPEVFRLAHEGRDLVYGTLLIIFVIYMPEGVLPKIKSLISRHLKSTKNDYPES